MADQPQHERERSVPEEKCIICLGLLEDVAVLPCGDLFCTSCIKRWARVGSLCPACREPMRQFASFDPPLWKSPQDILGDYCQHLSDDIESACNAPRHGTSAALWLRQLQRCLALHAERTGAPRAQLRVLELPAPSDSQARMRQAEQEAGDRAAAQQLEERGSDVDMVIDDDDDVEDRVCDKCRSGDDEEDLLLCSWRGCRASCHTYCLEPALVEAPDGDWFCMSCMHAAGAAPASSAAAAASQRRVPRVRHADDSDASVSSRSGDEQDSDYEPDSCSDAESDSDDDDSSRDSRASRRAQPARRRQAAAERHAIRSSADPAVARHGARSRAAQVAVDMAETQASAFAAAAAAAADASVQQQQQQQRPALLQPHALPVAGDWAPVRVQRADTVAAAAACHSAPAAPRDVPLTTLRRSRVPAVPAVTALAGVAAHGQHVLPPPPQMQAALHARVLRYAMPAGQPRAPLHVMRARVVLFRASAARDPPAHHTL